MIATAAISFKNEFWLEGGSWVGAQNERSRAERRLRIAFAAGTITDAAALLPMLFPRLARLLWGIENPSDAYFFAIGYAAALMLGWTLLLAWAYARPLERRFVAMLTVIVILGLAATEGVMVAWGAMTLIQVAPTWVLQLFLIYLFASAYFRASSRYCGAPPA